MYCPLLIKAFLEVQLETSATIKEYDGDTVITFRYYGDMYMVKLIISNQALNKYDDIDVIRLPKYMDCNESQTNLLRKFIKYAMESQ